MTKERTPRVLMVVRLFHPWVGGMERQALTLAGELARRGVDVRIVTGRWFRGTAREETIENVTVVRHNTLWEGFGIRGLRRLGGVIYMLSLAAYLFSHRSDYDIIHVHGLSYHAFVASALGRRLGKPVLVKLANSGVASDIAKMRSGQHLPLTRFMLPTALSCDRVIALNDLIAKELEEAGVDPARLERIPNGVLLSQPNGTRQRADRLRVLYLGRLHAQKGVDVLLRAMARIVPPDDKIHVVIAGDGPERSRLEKLAVNLHLDGLVEFVGMVDEPQRQMADADLLVLPSLAEGLSNVLLEAMSAGLAVVASDIEANRQLIEDGISGRLFAGGDVDDLTRVISALIDDPTRREALGANARASVEERYSIERVASRYLALYRELLEEPRG